MLAAHAQLRAFVARPMDYLPIALDVRHALCLVVGGGQVALRKIDWLLNASARVRVIALEACAEVSALHARGALELELRAYESADLAQVRLVIAATDDRALNARLSSEAVERGTLVNVVDDPALCSFIVPALVDRSPVVVAISTQGASPVLARLVRRRIEALLHPRLGALASFAAAHRKSVRDAIQDPTARRTLWERTLDGPIADAVLDGDGVSAERALREQLSERSGAELRTANPLSLLSVPSSLEDLTLSAMRALGAADVVVHDRAARQAVTYFGRRDARLCALDASDASAVHARIDELHAALAQGLRACIACAEDVAPSLARALSEARIAFTENTARPAR